MVAEGQRPGLSLCIGAPEFWARAKADMAVARRRVLVQAMTFEGDAAGLAVAEVIARSPAEDRRVLVDGYTRVNINDTSLSRRALRDPALAAEVAATDAMFRRLIAGNVPVRVTNPVNRLWTNYPARDHRKLIVADNVAYLGGINFSDHNFAWPDLMLRIDDAGAADFLADGFESTFQEEGSAAVHVEPVSASSPTAPDYHAAGDRSAWTMTLLRLDGRRNGVGFAPILELIAHARERIDLVSPYVTQPFLGALGAARRRGVAARVFTPALNNKPTVREALAWTAGRLDLQVVWGPEMSHLKGLLVDDETLVLGSSNFDFASLAAEAELLAIVRDPAVAAEFQGRVIAPALAEAIGPPRSSPNAGLGAALALRAAARVAGLARNARRFTVDWA